MYLEMSPQKDGVSCMQISSSSTNPPSKSRDDCLDITTNFDFLAVKFERLCATIDHPVSQPAFANFFRSMRRNEFHILFENSMSKYGTSNIILSDFAELFAVRTLKIVTFCR
jgi:hypothetical protein